jgi:catechol 2,3-dioxygenase-like lactoylglutathione lyase family enzyme
MSPATGLKILFVAGFGPIAKDPRSSKPFYTDVLGLPLDVMPGSGDYLHTEKLDGVRHFAIWPLTEAAQSCFGREDWPADIPEPHAWLEFDVEDVAAASAVLKSRGFRLLVDTREEPWGQTVTRLLSPEGILVGVTYTPWMRGKTSA